MSAFCNLCTRDADTGEYFCARLGGWVDKCPNFPDGYPVGRREGDAGRKDDDKWKKI